MSKESIDRYEDARIGDPLTYEEVKDILVDHSSDVTMRSDLTGEHRQLSFGAGIRENERSEALEFLEYFEGRVPDAYNLNMSDFEAEVEESHPNIEEDSISNRASVGYNFELSVDVEEDDLVNALREGDYEAVGDGRFNRLLMRVGVGLGGLFGDKEEVIQQSVDDCIDDVRETWSGSLEVSGEVPLSLDVDEVETYQDVLNGSRYKPMSESN